jgi:hypothetical protein
MCPEAQGFYFFAATCEGFSTRPGDSEADVERSSNLVSNWSAPRPSAWALGALGLADAIRRPLQH